MQWGRGSAHNMTSPFIFLLPYSLICNYLDINYIFVSQKEIWKQIQKRPIHTVWLHFLSVVEYKGKSLVVLNILWVTYVQWKWYLLLLRLQHSRIQRVVWVFSGCVWAVRSAIYCLMVNWNLKCSVTLPMSCYLTTLARHPTDECVCVCVGLLVVSYMFNRPGVAGAVL